MNNPWINHVKQYALANNVSYSVALREAGASYNKGSIVSEKDGRGLDEIMANMRRRYLPVPAVAAIPRLPPVPAVVTMSRPPRQEELPEAIPMGRPLVLQDLPNLSGRELMNLTRILSSIPPNQRTPEEEQIWRYLQDTYLIGGGTRRHSRKGGSLSSGDLNTLLKASYDVNTTLPEGFMYDKSISSKTSKVFYNPNTNQAVVAHMGTQGVADWGNNLIFALAGKSGYKMTARFKEAKDVQKKAEKKYGKENITTIGHSQGGLQAEILGERGKETITVNKATRPLTVFEKTQKNQTDVRSSADLVSGFAPLQKKGKKGITIKAETYDPLSEHATDILDRYDGQIGTDVYKAPKKQKKSKFNPLTGFI